MNSLLFVRCIFAILLLRAGWSYTVGAYRRPSSGHCLLSIYAFIAVAGAVDYPAWGRLVGFIGYLLSGSSRPDLAGKLLACAAVLGLVGLVLDLRTWCRPGPEMETETETETGERSA